MNIISFLSQKNKENLTKPSRRVYELKDGAKVIYMKNYVKETQSLFNELLNTIPWQQWQYKFHDKEVPSPRLIHVIHLFDNSLTIPEFLKIRAYLEELLDLKFNHAVVNYYRNGQDSIAPHSDKEVNSNQFVVSLTLGAMRKFVLSHIFRKNETHEFMLDDGDILILNHEAITKMYTHAVPKMKECGPRINITFRQ